MSEKKRKGKPVRRAEKNAIRPAGALASRRGPPESACLAASQSEAVNVGPGPTRRERRRVRSIAITGASVTANRGPAAGRKRPGSQGGLAVLLMRTMRTPSVSLRLQEQRLTRSDWHQGLPRPSASHGCHRR
jgi:hypothetical protein